jgi:uncharacterized protein YndB with AHSA1/START domain
MLKSLFRLLLVALIAFLGFAATRPDHFHVERSTLIQATPDRVFAQLQDFRRWSAWSPWEGKDPAMKRDFSGAASGPGAVYAWSGNRQVGSGRMEITEAQAPAKLVIRLDFFEPFEAHNTATFTLSPQGGATRLTWAMDGPSPFLTKVIHLLMPMEKMVGPDFERGLAKLRELTEDRPAGVLEPSSR